MIILQLFYVIHERSFHLLECVDDTHCHDALPACDNEAHQCVGKNIMLSNIIKSDTLTWSSNWINGVFYIVYWTKHYA